MAYLAVAWLLIQIASIILPAFNAPDILLKILIYVLIVGLPIWIAFSWLYDLTPEGFKKTEEALDNEAQLKMTGQRLNKVIIASLLVVIAVLVVNQIYMQASLEPSSDLSSPRQYANAIAVLPFKDLSPEEDQQFFADGISHGILNLLTRIDNLKVISNNSSFTFRGSEKTFPEMAKELGVNFLLDGTLQLSDSTMRITTKLIDGSDGSQIWDRQFDREIADAFQIQDEIAYEVARQLKLTFADENWYSEKTNFEAYRLFLEAEQHYNALTPEGMEKAQALVRRSIASDSTYARSWVLLAQILDRSHRNFALMETEEGERLVRKALNKAISLDPQNGHAYSELAFYESYNNNAGAAYTLLQKAESLESSNAEISRMSGAISLFLGDPEKSVEKDLEAFALDPLNPRYYRSLGFNYLILKDYDAVLENLDKFLYYNPGANIVHGIKSMAFSMQNKHTEALRAAEQEQADWAKTMGLSAAHFGLGNQVESDSLLRYMVEKYGNNGNGQIVAASYAFRGDADNTFYWLEKQLLENRRTLQEVINWPQFSKVYDDPRWDEFLKKMRLPEEHWLLKNINQ